MFKQTIQYTSPVDALVAMAEGRSETIAKRLSLYESQKEMTSEEFFNRYTQGQLDDDTLFIEWANDYRHYLDIPS